MPTKFNTAKLNIMSRLSALPKYFMVLLMFIFFVGSVIQTTTFFQLRLEADYSVDDDPDTAVPPGIVILTTMGSGKEGHFRGEWGSSKEETPWSEITGTTDKTLEEMFEGPYSFGNFHKYSWETDDKFSDGRFQRHSGEFNPFSFLARKGWVQLSQPGELKPYKKVIDNFYMGFMLNPELDTKYGAKFRQHRERNNRAGFGLFMAILPNTDSFKVQSIQIRDMDDTSSTVKGGGHFNFSRDYVGDSKCIGGKCYFSFNADFTHKNCNSGAYGGSDIQTPGKFYEVYHKQGWFNGVESAGDTFCYDETVTDIGPITHVKASDINQDLLISLEEGKMMPVYSLSKDSLFIGKDCRGCTDDRAGRRNDTHNKTGSEYSHPQPTKTPYKKKVCSGSRRMGTDSCNLKDTYYPPNEGDFFNDRNLWNDVWFGEPESQDENKRDYIYHQTETEQIPYALSADVTTIPDSITKSSKWWGFKGIKTLIEEGKIKPIANYRTMSDILSKNGDTQPLKIQYNKLKEKFNDSYELYVPTIGNKNDMKSFAINHDFTPKDEAILLALGGAYNGGDLWINDCCAGHKGDYADVYDVKDVQYQINIKFTQIGNMVHAVHKNLADNVKSKPLGKGMTTLRLTPVTGEEKSFDVNPDGPNFAPDKYESASLTIQSNDRCIAEVYSKNYNRNEPEPINNINETVLFDSAPLNLTPGASNVYTEEKDNPNKYILDDTNLKVEIRSFLPTFEIESEDDTMGSAYHGSLYVTDNVTKANTPANRIAQGTPGGKSCAYYDHFQFFHIKTEKYMYLDKLSFYPEANVVNVYSKDNKDNWIKSQINGDKITEHIQFSIAPDSNNPLTLLAQTTKEQQEAKLTAHFKPFPGIKLYAINGGNMTRKHNGHSRIQRTRENIRLPSQIDPKSPTKNLIFEGSEASFRYKIQPVTEECYQNDLPKLCHKETKSHNQSPATNPLHEPAIRFKFTNNLKRLYIASKDEGDDFYTPQLIFFKDGTTDEAIDNIWVSNNTTIDEDGKVASVRLSIGSEELQIPDNANFHITSSKDNLVRGIYKFISPPTEDFYYNNFNADNFSLRFHYVDENDEATNDLFQGFYLDFKYLMTDILVGIDFDPFSVTFLATTSDAIEKVNHDNNAFTFQNKSILNKAKLPIEITPYGENMVSENDITLDPSSATFNQVLKYNIKVKEELQTNYYISNILEATSVIPFDETVKEGGFSLEGLIDSAKSKVLFDSLKGNNVLDPNGTIIVENSSITIKNINSWLQGESNDVKNHVLFVLNQALGNFPYKKIVNPGNIISRKGDISSNLSDSENLFLSLNQFTTPSSEYNSRPIVSDTDIYVVLKKYVPVYIRSSSDDTVKIPGFFHFSQDGLLKPYPSDDPNDYSPSFYPIDMDSESDEESFVIENFTELNPNIIKATHETRVGLRDTDNPKLNITPSQGFDIDGIFILYDSNKTDAITITNDLISGEFCEDDDNTHVYNSKAIPCLKILSTNGGISTYNPDQSIITGWNTELRENIAGYEIISGAQLTPNEIKHRDHENMFIYVTFKKNRAYSDSLIHE